MKNRNIYIFIRADGFYPLELENDAVAKANAELNPGTLRVETTNGKTVWTKTVAAMPNSIIHPNPVYTIGLARGIS